MDILVLGAGAWGTALAISAGERHRVTLWARDAAQAAVPATTLPVDAGGVPVQGLGGHAAVEVQQEHAAVALALATAAHHRCGDQGGQASLLADDRTEGCGARMKKLSDVERVQMTGMTIVGFSRNFYG